MEKVIHKEWTEGCFGKEPRVRYIIVRDDNGINWMCTVNRTGEGRSEEDATPWEKVYDVTSYGNNWKGILMDYLDGVLNPRHPGGKSIVVDRIPISSLRSEKWNCQSIYDVVAKEKSLTFAQIRKIMAAEGMEICEDGLCRYINRHVVRVIDTTK